jgi:uncharacterized protein
MSAYGAKRTSLLLTRSGYRSALLVRMEESQNRAFRRSMTTLSAHQINRVQSLILRNKWNAILLDRTPSLGLGDWWLTAGCIAQTVWNGLYGRAPDHGILDYDIFYFDTDTSWKAEDCIIGNATAAFSDLPITVQIRNQARVPLWYEAKFGVAFPEVARASDGIDRFPCRTVSVGIRRTNDDYVIHAPFGLDALLGGKLIPNPELEIPSVYADKTARWMEVWPELIALPWPGADPKALEPKGNH